MRFVIRVDRMGAKVEVRGLAVGDEHIHRFERTVRDVVRADGLPVRIDLTDAGAEDRADLVHKLRAAFVSDQAIGGKSCPGLPLETTRRLTSLVSRRAARP